MAAPPSSFERTTAATATPSEVGEQSIDRSVHAPQSRAAWTDPGEADSDETQSSREEHEALLDEDMTEVLFMFNCNPF